MTKPHRPRGRHLVAADRAFATGGGPLARLLGGGFHALLDRIDAGLVAGGIDATLPDGSRRRLGGRRPGPMPIVHLHRWRALMRLATSGSVGWYKGWAAGDWSSPDPVPLFDLFMRNAASLGDSARSKGLYRLANRLGHRRRGNDRRGARKNVAYHYDLGNDFYAAWLDAGMTYSSAIFADPGAADAEPLETAQARKIARLLARLELSRGDRLLDIGCGWGSLLEAAVRDHGVEAEGITLSAEQKAYADRRLAGAATVRLMDYRDAAGTYDAITSVEMVEAIGEDQWPHFLAAIARLLRSGGRAALQFISIREELFDAYAANTDFIQTYIFPGGMLISEPRFQAIADLVGLSWHDREGYGLHYAETLKRWRANFDAAVAEGRLPPGFNRKFHALWRYYLMYCEGGFRGGGIDVAQVTLVKR